MKKLTTCLVAPAALAVMALSAPAMAQHQADITLQVNVVEYLEFYWDTNVFDAGNIGPYSGQPDFQTQGTLRSNVPAQIEFSGGSLTGPGGTIPAYFEFTPLDGAFKGWNSGATGGPWPLSMGTADNTRFPFYAKMLYDAWNTPAGTYSGTLDVTVSRYYP